MVISALINMISEAYSLCIGFLLLVRMEHCYPTFYNIFRISYITYKLMKYFFSKDLSGKVADC